MPHPLRWLALVALERPELPAFERLSDWHAQQYPESPPLAAAGSTPSLLTFTIGDFTAAATLVPRPIPWSQLEGPAAAAWYWPEATDALGRQAAHLLVTLVDEGGQPLAKALALTRLTAALAATAPSIGVVWGPGRLVHPPAAFIEQAAAASEHNLPLFSWIDFRVEPLDDSGGAAVRLFTTGLEALGAQEIEVERYQGDARELVGLVYNVAHYLLDRRKAINDGDTIGVTDEVQVTVRRDRSMLGGDLEVIRLDFDRAS
jgi:hypothetical protein